MPTENWMTPGVPVERKGPIPPSDFTNGVRLMSGKYLRVYQGDQILAEGQCLGVDRTSVALVMRRDDGSLMLVRDYTHAITVDFADEPEDDGA